MMWDVCGIVAGVSVGAWALYVLSSETVRAVMAMRPKNVDTRLRKGIRTFNGMVLGGPPVDDSRKSKTMVARGVAKLESFAMEEDEILEYSTVHIDTTFKEITIYAEFLSGAVAFFRGDPDPQKDQFVFVHKAQIKLLNLVVTRAGNR